MQSMQASLLMAFTLLTGCATTASAPPSVTPDAAKKVERDVEKPAEAKVKPDHLALVPNLPHPDYVETEIKQDFNGDGVLDLGLVTTPPGNHRLQANETQRTLTLGIRDGSGYRSVQSTECIAFCPQCGGIMGDPYQGFEKGKDGSITVHNYGGSRHRWSVSYTIAWHKDAFHVVGVKRSSFDSLKPNTQEESSLNFLTGTRTSTDKNAAKTHGIKPMRINACDAIEKP